MNRIIPLFLKETLVRCKTEWNFRRRRGGSIWLGQLLAALFLAIVIRPSAYGHAVLLHTDPVSKARLSEGPAKVHLVFNERVEPIFNAVRVVDRQGRRVDRGEANVVEGGEVVEVELESLAEGPYAVAWRITSVDGHPVQGNFGFGVGSDPPGEEALRALFGAQENSLWRFFSPILKGITLTAIICWLGGIAFLTFVFSPAVAATLEPDRRQEFVQQATRRPIQILWVSALAFLAMECFSLIGQTTSLTGLPLERVLSMPILTTVLTTTNYGEWWAVRMLSGLALAAMSYWRLRRGGIALRTGAPGKGQTIWPVAGSLALGGIVLLTIPLTGHARGMVKGVPLAIASDWIHLAATAVWVGGLIHFLFVIFFLHHRGNGGEKILSALAHRFSSLAKICVLALLVTGIYNAWLHMPTWLSFVSTDYGRVLVAKLILLVPLLLIAAANLRRTLPALAGFAKNSGLTRHGASRFRKLVQGEVVLGVAIVGLVAVLTNLPPASAVATGAVSLSRRAGDFTVSLSLEPNKVGSNHALIRIQDSAGYDVSDAKRVFLYVRSLDMDMGLTTAEAHLMQGHYQAEVFLSMGGKWAVSVEVTPSRGDSFVTEFEFSSAL